MEIHLKLCGLLLIGLALVHVVFPRYFDWKTELARLSLINRQIMLVHTFFISLTVLLMGALCLTSAHDLTATPLGRRVCLGLGVFWLIRLGFQLFGYSKETWRGKRLETAAHVAFTMLWFYLTAVFLLAARATAG